jgi:hypothetical protein
MDTLKQELEKYICTSEYELKEGLNYLSGKKGELNSIYQGKGVNSIKTSQSEYAGTDTLDRQLKGFVAAVQCLHECGIELHVTRQDKQANQLEVEGTQPDVKVSRHLEMTCRDFET